MSRAWRTQRKYPSFTFSECLIKAWAIEKRNQESIDWKSINRLLNTFQPFQLKSTSEHKRLLNKRKTRLLLKSKEESETKEMIANGELFLGDIMHQRRMDSKNFSIIHKVSAKFRNRKIDTSKCEKINIDEFIRNNQ